MVKQLLSLRARQSVILLGQGMLVVGAERVANERRSCKSSDPLFLRSLINGLAKDRIRSVNQRANFYITDIKTIINRGHEKSCDWLVPGVREPPCLSISIAAGTKILKRVKMLVL